MAQHFLLSKSARTLSVQRVATLSEERARRLMAKFRWGHTQRITCPHCQCRDKHYWIASRKQWRCKDIGCQYRFSVTSGTILAHCKLPLRTCLLAIMLYTNAVKGISACELSRTLCITYRAAFTLLHKIRTILQVQDNQPPFQQETHIDGTYVHAKVRSLARKDTQPDRRKAKNGNPNKRCLLVMRELYSESEKHANPKLKGAKRTLVFPIQSEQKRVVQKLVREHIKLGTRVHTDENPAYDGLYLHYDLQRVNHSKEYCSPDGITNNQAESFFSRFKRCLFGHIHKLSNKYLFSYACEIAYREDNRRTPNGKLFKAILKRCMQAKPSRDWTGYNQGNNQDDEVLFVVETEERMPKKGKKKTQEQDTRES